MIYSCMPNSDRYSACTEPKNSQACSKTAVKWKSKTVNVTEDMIGIKSETDIKFIYTEGGTLLC